MHKVLVIAYYFPPMGLSGVQRTLKFIKYLKKYGWEPTVITTKNVAYFAHDKSLQRELEATGVEVIRVGAKEPNSLLSKFGTIKLPREINRKVVNRFSQTFFIPDNKISWAKKAAKKALEVLQDESYELVFITGPPFSAFHEFAKIKNKIQVPLVLDYRDLWYNSYFAFYPTPLHKILHKKMEYDSLKAAELVIVTNRIVKEKIIKKYSFLTHNDIAIINHGFDPEDFDKAIVETKSNNRLRLTYSGIFMEYNSPKYFLQAFKQITINRPDIAKNIELHFVGFLREENKKIVRKLNLQEFVFDSGYINHDEAVVKIKSSDVLWFMVGKLKNIDAILPGKVYEYIGTKKPILACVPDGAAKLALNEYPAAYICEPDNVNQIKETIIKIYELYKRNELPVVEDEFLTKFRRDNLTEQLSKQFNKLLGAKVI